MHVAPYWRVVSGPQDYPQAAVLKWEGKSSTWETDDINPETLLKHLRCAVLQLVADDCYHARLGSISLILDLFKMSRDTQVRSTSFTTQARCVLTCLPGLPPSCPGQYCLELHPLANRTRTHAAVQRDFRDVAARLRLLSLGTPATDCIEEHMETSILILGMSRSGSIIRWRQIALSKHDGPCVVCMAGETAMERGELEEHALLLLIGHAARCPRQRPLVQKLLVSVASRLAYPSLSHYVAYHAATLSYTWLQNSYTVADMLSVQVRSLASTGALLPVLHVLCEFASPCQNNSVHVRRACCHCQRRM